MGASRWRIVRQLLTESLLLSMAGGAAGLLLAVWTVRLLYPIVLSSIPLPPDLTYGFAVQFTPDWRVFGFALLAAAAAGIAAGLAPALQASKPELVRSLKDDGSPFGRHLSQSRLRHLLVVAQVGMCMVLLTAAGLLARNLQNLRTIDTGMNLSQTFSVAVGLNDDRAKKDARRLAELRRQLVERLSSTPGVSVVSTAHQLPLSGQIGNTAITLPGQSVDHPFEARFNFVSAEYFDALSIPLSRGRHFTREEVNSGSPVVVISEATARRWWPDVDPLGKSVGIAAGSSHPEDAGAGKSGTTYRQYQVIGIARDARSRWVWEKDETMFYVPRPIDGSSNEYLIVRATGGPEPVMNSARSIAATIDPSLRVSVKNLTDSLGVQMAPFRAIAWLSGGLGILALALASVGLYGVMSFLVTQRTRETGIRMALGAQGLDVVRLFLSHGLRLTVIGILCGAAGAALAARLLAAVLIDLSPFDPLTFIGVSIFLTVVALLAILVPTRRATKVDPMVALRYE